jgi:uncharacterized FlaG/YvyC family protein
MDVASLNHGVQASTATAPTPIAPANKAAENREVIQAVKALNGSQMFGQENELMFQRDRQTQRMIVRVVNRTTQEVVSQIPAEYVLRLADNAPKTATQNEARG